MKFDGMKYKRIDTDKLRKEYDILTKRAKNSLSQEEIFECIDTHESLLKEFSTMQTLAYIRNSVNTKDEFYEKEIDFFDENSPIITESVQNFMKVLIDSPYKDKIAEKFCPAAFRNIEMSLKCFNEKIIPLVQEENKLSSAYQKLVAGAKINFKGEDCTLAKLGAFKQSEDRQTRKEAFTAEGNYFISISEELDEIYSKLVMVRDKIAKTMGFSGYTEYSYLNRCRNGYGRDDVNVFRNEVKDKLVPLVNKLRKMQSGRIGIEDLKLYDLSVCFKEGNPKPIGNTEEILQKGKTLYEEMSGETAEFINFMFENFLFDVESKDGKAQGGYCTYIPEYKAPFIFSNFNGTSADVDVLTHEAGHAFASYRTRNFKYSESAEPTMEICEVHSMAMEFFAWPYLDRFYGQDTDRAKFVHLQDAIVFLPYGCMVDEFQHIMYDNINLTPRERCNIWLELEKQYRPGLDFDSLPFYSEGRTWQRQLHIYQYPFYYIDYCLSGTVALAFFADMIKGDKSAFSRYLGFVDAGAKYDFATLCKRAGFSSPFEVGFLEKVVSGAQKWLLENSQI